MKKIVCLGGGNAMPKLILENLKNCPVEITALCSMLDSGGSSGQLRVDFNVLPAGDIRRQCLALSDAEKWKKDVFNFRLGREVFDDGHGGHSLGSAFITALEHSIKDMKKVLDILSDFLDIKRHKVLPATIEKSHIMAILENGEAIIGEDEIDVPRKHDSKLRIEKMSLSKPAKAYPPAIEAIKKADLIVVGPGDFYSTLIPFFLINGIKETLKKTKAKKVFICNAMTKLGETNNFSVSDFVKESEKYFNSEFDFIVYNTGKPSEARIKNYKKEHPELLELVKIDKNLPKTKKYIGENLLISSGPIIYDSKKIIKIITSFLNK